MVSLSRRRRGLAGTVSVVIVALLLGLLPGAVAAAGDDVASLSLGVAHRCALKTDGSVWCWGANEKHQIGDATDTLRTSPVRVVREGGGFLGGVRALGRTAGDHTCALKLDRTVRCWGQNDNDELGDGTTVPRTTFVTTIVAATGQPLAGVAQLASGDDHSCAVRTNGTAWCWGYNTYGRLGDGSVDQSAGAVQVRRGSGFLGNVTAIATGSFHSCALLEDTTVRCWGRNDRGQLGDGTIDQRLLPVAVRTASGSLLRGVIGIAAGYRHTCALLSDRTVRCWGDNVSAQLGDGSTEERHHPVKVRRGSGFLTGVRQLSASGDNVCAVTTNDDGFCWGDNSTGAVGVGTKDGASKARRVLRANGPLTGIRQIATSGGHSCAVRKDATAWCWGYNFAGNLGTGSPALEVLFAERVSFP